MYYPLFCCHLLPSQWPFLLYILLYIEYNSPTYLLELSFTNTILPKFFLGIRASPRPTPMSTSLPQSPNAANNPASNNQAQGSSQAAAVTSNNAQIRPIYMTNYTQPFNILNQPFPLKLDRNSYYLWKTMVSTIIRGHRLDGFVYGTRPCPFEFVPAETSDGQVGFGVQLNPEYEHWIVSDQLLMGWLYILMNEAISTEVMGCTTAAGLWKALENLYGAHSK